MSASFNSSYWCYRCAQFVRAVDQPNSPTCPNCSSGFLEQIHSPLPPSPPPPNADLRRFHVRPRHHSSTTANQSPFNPVILLRNNPSDPVPETRFDLYYDDGSGSGLRPLPASMSEFLMASGFDRLLDQLSTIGSATVCQRNPPASKAAIESLPLVEINFSNNSDNDLNCAVCIEKLEAGTEAREMPCKHLYHEECIFPWLSVRNTCPVCRHEVQPESPQAASQEEGEAAGMTIWRLPGGGYAVGRFAGGREVPVVYTEMDGNGFGSNSGSEPRRVSWNGRGERVGERRESGGVGRALRNFVVSLWRRRSTSSENANSFRSRRSSSQSSSSASGTRVLRIHRGGSGSQILH